MAIIYTNSFKHKPRRKSKVVQVEKKPKLKSSGRDLVLPDLSPQYHLASTKAISSLKTNQSLTECAPKARYDDEELAQREQAAVAQFERMKKEMVPLHKSSYVRVTDKSMLLGLNKNAAV